MTYYYVEHRQPQYKPQGRQGQGYGTANNTPNAQFPVRQEGFVRPPQQQQQQQAGPSEEVPPSYQQVVGDNKVQHP